MLYADFDCENDETDLQSDFMKDDKCLQVLDNVESDLLIVNNEISNQQLVKHVEQVELETQFQDVTDSQLMNDVQIIESKCVLLLFDNGTL